MFCWFRPIRLAIITKAGTSRSDDLRRGDSSTIGGLNAAVNKHKSDMVLRALCCLVLLDGRALRKNGKS